MPLKRIADQAGPSKDLGNGQPGSILVGEKGPFQLSIHMGVFVKDCFQVITAESASRKKAAGISTAKTFLGLVFCADLFKMMSCDDLQHSAVEVSQVFFVILVRRGFDLVVDDGIVDFKDFLFG